MNKKVIGVLAIIILGIAIILSIKFLAPVLFNLKQKNTSDAKDIKGTVTIEMDNFVGYFIISSKEMKRRIRAQGYALKCIDDNANYAERMKKLAEGKIDFAVATVDSYILNDAPEKFSGVIISGIDESKGVDAVVARGIANLEELKKRHGNFKIAFTPNSPSEHLLKAIGDHFDIPELRQKKASWRVETNGSSEALKKLLAGKVDVAVIWEPDVSRALSEKGITRLIGTEDTKRLIVDILLANRDRVRPEIANMVLNNYFKTLKYYRDNSDVLKKELVTYTKSSEAQVEAMLKGIEWINLEDNAKNWFGIKSPGASTTEGMIDTIESTVQILVENNDFKKNPLPNEDPYRLVNSSFIESLYKQSMSGQFATAKTNLAAKAASKPTDKSFAPLSDSAWANLKEIGTLRILPITFRSGTASLNLEGKEQLDKAVKNLEHYPNYRVVLKGHTGVRGEPKENQRLSQERVNAVKKYLMVTHNMSENRLRAIGMGGEEPLPRDPGESDRSYNYRLPRVEIRLMAETM